MPFIKLRFNWWKCYQLFNCSMQQCDNCLTVTFSCWSWVLLLGIPWSQEKEEPQQWSRLVIRWKENPKRFYQQTKYTTRTRASPENNVAADRYLQRKEKAFEDESVCVVVVLIATNDTANDHPDLFMRWNKKASLAGSGWLFLYPASRKKKWVTLYMCVCRV